ncbi:ATP-binding cassette domain-containing protein [Streptomyces parvus]|uniref:ATP-binding cassette domain-containing protein n=1 Tax=Streptomyces parvus TaxID=66428 RepID=UPI00340F273A
MEAGERVGRVGPTGSGKTTLAKLMTGLYAPDSGTVRYDGHDLATLAPAELRRRIVLIPQRVHLVEGTLLDNLRLVPGDPDEQRITEAVDHLGLANRVRSLEEGLHTDLGRGTGRLSAGELQLIGLVRAALLDPAVLVLDEATADIDPETARTLETAIDTLRTDRTLIVIAHREATIKRLPRIIRSSTRTPCWPTTDTRPPDGPAHGVRGHRRARRTRTGRRLGCDRHRPRRIQERTPA